MKLTNANIDKTVAEVQNFFENAGISKKDGLKLSLVIEESLLRFQERFGIGHEFRFSTSKWFSAPKIKIRVKGQPFNPLEETESDDEIIFSPEIMQHLMKYEGAGTVYRYENGCNEISSFSKKERKPIKIPGGSITISILLAIVFSFLVTLLPQNFQKFIIDEIATPIFSAIMSLIVAVNIPLVFFSIISSVCAMGDISTFSNVGSKVIGRFFVLMLIIAAISIGICEIFFPAISLSDFDAPLVLAEVRDLFLSVVPKNLSSPFVEGAILQIVLIALLTSACVVFLGERVKNLKSVIIEINSVVFRMMELVLKLLPLAIFLIVFRTILTTTTSDILTIWRIIAASYLTYLVVVVVMMIRLVAKYKISIKDFLQKISPTLMVSFATGSGTASMLTNFEVCKKNLKLDEKLCDFWIPLSHTLFSPGTVISMVVYAFFGAIFSGETISFVELIVISFLAVQLSICSPKVSGANLAILTMLLTQLGFSVEALGAVAIADGFINNVSGVFGMLARDCELYDVSHEVKF